MLSTSCRYDEGLPATETVCATPEARELLVKADAAMQFRNMCGVARAGNCHYTKDGRLWETNKYGIYEVMHNPTRASTTW